MTEEELRRVSENYDAVYFHPVCRPSCLLLPSVDLVVSPVQIINICITALEVHLYRQKEEYQLVYFLSLFQKGLSVTM